MTGRPLPRSRAWLVETCRAELEWAGAEWRHLTGDDGDRAREADPSEAWRLPHERAAARVINCHLHLVVDVWQLRRLGPRLRSQRKAALDGGLDVRLRLYWANAAAGTVGDYKRCLARRKLAWRCFLAAAAEYRRLKTLIERTNLHAAA